MKLRPNCAARTVAADILPIIEISQKVGIPIEVACFIGSSPIRQYAEDWDLDRMLRMTEEAVSLAVKEGLPVMYVTEDTTRAHPDHIRRMYTTAIRAGAGRVCVCDTVGHATPNGVQNLIRFVCRAGRPRSTPRSRWTGTATRTAASASPTRSGPSRPERTASTPARSESGERVGNTPMDQLLVNLQLLGWIDRDLTKLHDYCSSSCRARPGFRSPTTIRSSAATPSAPGPASTPRPSSRRARRATTGWRTGSIRACRPAMVGRRQAIEVGPMSGLSNVQCWLENHGIEPRPELTDAIFQRAKQSDQVLSDEEILAVVQAFTAARRLIAH